MYLSHADQSPLFKGTNKLSIQGCRTGQLTNSRYSKTARHLRLQDLPSHPASYPSRQPTETARKHRGPHVLESPRKHISCRQNCDLAPPHFAWTKASPMAHEQEIRAGTCTRQFATMVLAATIGPSNLGTQQSLYRSIRQGLALSP